MKRKRKKAKNGQNALGRPVLADEDAGSPSDEVGGSGSGMDEPSKKEGRTIDEFVEGLIKAFKRLSRKNVETLSILVESIRGMSPEDAARLGWELTILDAYIILRHSSDMIKDEKKARLVNQMFLKRLNEDVLDHASWGEYFRVGTATRYKSYFDDLLSAPSPKDNLERLSGEVAHSIFGEHSQEGNTLWALGVYVGAHSEYVKSLVFDFLKRYELTGE